jgi:hypothetical protein
MTKLLTETADYDEPGSWGRMSEGWPYIIDRAYDRYVFANCVTSIPYGSYVFMGDRLRVHSEYIEQLNTDFEKAGRPDSRESVKRRQETGTVLPSGNHGQAPQWWHP